jgi:hypothetical protein
MKIALLICGTRRNYKENYPTWQKYLLNKYNIDIFFHTYDVIGYHKQNNNTLTKNDIDNLINTIKPKNYIIDSFDNKLKYFKSQVKTQCLRTGVHHQNQ